MIEYQKFLVCQIFPNYSFIKLNIFINLLEEKKTQEGIIDLPHRRFEWSPFVKLLYRLDPTTFHQLGISVRDSYIENGKFEK
jgi:hypothetical protein